MEQDQIENMEEVLSELDGTWSRLVIQFLPLVSKPLNDDSGQIIALSNVRNTCNGCDGQ